MGMSDYINRLRIPSAEFMFHHIIKNYELPTNVIKFSARASSFRICKSGFLDLEVWG
jgi:hypothetical protein